MITKILNLDQELFLFLNGIHSDFSDYLFWQISNKFIWIPLYLSIFAYIIYKYKLQSIGIIFLFIIAITLSDQISSTFFKEYFQRLRPCHNEGIKQIVHIVNGYCGGNYGFISSHASNSMLFAILSTYFIRNKYYTFSIIIWALTVSYSRVALGVHYPLDIVAGIILGIILSIILYKIYILVKQKNNLKIL